METWLMPSVAGAGFGGFFLVGGAVAFAMAITVGIGMAVAVRVAVAAGWGDGYGLARRGGQAGVGEVGGDGFGDVLDRADLDDGGLGLLQDQLFVDGADLGLFLVGLLATGTIFFRGGLRNALFQVAYTPLAP